MSTSRDSTRSTARSRPNGPPTAPPTRSTGMLLLITALIVAGSLYPFDFSLPASQAAAWERLFEEYFPDTSKLEVLGEIALFAAFGFAGVSAFPSTSRPAAQAVAVMLMAFVLAALRQIAQIYFPPWAPVLGNVVWNLIGAGLGIAAGLWLQRHPLSAGEIGRRACVPAILLALWLTAELLPFAPTLNPQWIKDVVKALLRLPSIAPIDALWHAAGVLIAGRALTEVLGKSKAWLLLAVLLGAVAAGKVLIVSQVLTASALAGFAAGFLLWIWLSQWRGKWRVDVVLIVALVAAYTLKQLQPFEARPVPEPFGWLPFTGIQQGSMLNRVQGLAASAFAFGGLLGIVRMRGSSVGAGSIALALWIAMVQAIQVFVAGRAPGVTEPLLVLLVWLTLHYAPSSNSPNPRSSPMRRGAPS